MSLNTPQYAQRPVGSHFGLFAKYTSTVMTLILIVAFLDLPTYIHAAIRDTVLPKYFFWAFAIMLTPLLISRCQRLDAFMLNGFALSAIGFIILNIVHVFAYTNDNSYQTQIVATRTQYIGLAILLSFSVSVAETGIYERIFPLLTVIISALIFTDFLVPGFFYPLTMEGAIIGRAAAVFINPNRAGEAVLISALLAMPVTSNRYRTLLLLIAGGAALVTFSRGAALCWALLWMGNLLNGRRKLAAVLYTAAILVAIPIIVEALQNYIINREDLASSSKNIIARLSFFETQSLEDASAQERAFVLQEAIRYFINNPLFGQGAGSTYLWRVGPSAHNQTAMLAAEYGLVGVGLWFSMLIAIWNGRYFPDVRLQRLSVGVVGFLSLFTHNIFDAFYWLVALALLSRRPLSLDYSKKKDFTTPIGRGDAGKARVGRFGMSMPRQL